MRLPPLNALRAFEAAARHQSIVRAADELCVTQGAVSRHVKLLEEDLGIRLFRRLPRGIELTEQGRSLLPILSDAFESIAIGARQVASAKRDLKIISPPSFSIRWLIPRLESFRERFPDIQIRLTTAMYDWDEFYGGDFDLAFDCGNPARPDGFEAVTILPELLTPVCAPEILDAGPLLERPEDLAAFELLHSTPDRRDWTVWLEAYGVKGVNPMSGEVFPNLDMAIKAAVMGRGMVIGDMVLIQDELETRKLVRPLHDLTLTTGWQGYCLVGPAGCWDDHRVSAFKSWLLEIAAEDGP
jgi:LysR family glycine cleavage system transcriptional activator